VSLCTAAQTGSCTTITGNCTDFCAAIAGLTPLAGCTTQEADYTACLGTAADVCQHSCGVQLQDLHTCLGMYCVSDPTDPDCQKLVASFK
jgi:hypothetical protein